MRRTAELWHKRIDELGILFDALGLAIVHDYSRSVVQNNVTLANFVAGEYPAKTD